MEDDIQREGRGEAAREEVATEVLAGITEGMQKSDLQVLMDDHGRSSMLPCRMKCWPMAASPAGSSPAFGGTAAARRTQPIIRRLCCL